MEKRRGRKQAHPLDKLSSEEANKLNVTPITPHISEEYKAANPEFFEDSAEIQRERPNPRVEAARQRGNADRIPLGVPHYKLSVSDYAEQLEGYVPRWINDDGARIQRAINGGYEPVFNDNIKVGDGEDRNTDMGSWVSQIVGKQENGSPLRAYLMKIRQEWYDEDQAKKQAPIDEIDEAIKGGKIAPQEGDKRYVKNIQYETNRR